MELVQHKINGLIGWTEADEAAHRSVRAHSVMLDLLDRRKRDEIFASAPGVMDDIDSLTGSYNYYLAVSGAYELACYHRNDLNDMETQMAGITDYPDSSLPPVARQKDSKGYHYASAAFVKIPEHPDAPLLWSRLLHFPDGSHPFRPYAAVTFINQNASFVTRNHGQPSETDKLAFIRGMIDMGKLLNLYHDEGLLMTGRQFDSLRFQSIPYNVVSPDAAFYQYRNPANNLI
ncbi:MAG: hypothetical protein TR69_WS6001000738 [candidate division WS6 bacterium OLB20]|uniref:Uncharacterized protein n=1 Tax=candidate division WS6 bacterium OLB20 TaxID=1617426 RepID=A0A136LYH4_9BACT|nr:MAG: hypothetical protein TR69_WS6001000738 [candidate division WS6 bacterium OLB20]